MNRIAGLCLVLAALGSPSARAEFRLEPLPYPADALEPFLDRTTMEIHHGRHHQAYVDNLNQQVQTFPELNGLSLEALQGRMSRYNEAVRNHGGGHYNHSFFWRVMAPAGTGGEPGPELRKAIEAAFGSLEEMQRQFQKAALGRFGSGWAWLIVTPERRLAITSTPNQDNPLMDFPGLVQGIPILGIDVWEHAYYLKYQNRRGDYIQAWWNVVNWNEVNRRFSEAMKPATR